MSEIIRRELVKSHESLRAIAERAGLDHTQLSRFARQERTLSQAALDALFDALGLTVAAKRKRRVQ